MQTNRLIYSIGFSTINDAQIKRLQKSQGTCKINHSCTSGIKVTIENGKYHVEWQKTHYGHDFELKHIRLQKSDRNCIASKLISGVTPQRLVIKKLFCIKGN